MYNLEELFTPIFSLDFVKTIQDMGGSVFIVGGAVRDAILGKDPKDIDIIVSGIPINVLQHIMNQHGKYDLVGESFGVFKFTTFEGEMFDIALPRVDKPGKEFVVTQDPTLGNPTVFKILYGGPINENNKV